MQLNNNTILNTSISNTSMSFQALTPVYTDLLIIDSNAIVMYNISYTSLANGIYYINISFLNQTSINKHIDSIEFPYIDFSSDTIKTIKNNLSSIVNLTISNISVRSCSLITSVSYISASGLSSASYNVLSDYNCSNNFIDSLGIDNVENTSASSFNQLSISYFSGASTGGGASDTSNNLPSGDNNTYLCYKTFDYIKSYGNNQLHLDELVDKIKLERNYTESKTKIQDYLNNWQLFCSINTNLTLKEDEVCSKIYYWAVDNGNNYTVNDIISLKGKIDSEIIPINFKVLKNYIDNYDTKCYTLINKKLPSKKTPFEIKNLNFLKDLPKCTNSFNNSILDSYIPFLIFSIPLNDLSCNSIDSWRWVFRLENVAGNDFKATGLKLNVLLIPIGLILGFFIIRFTITFLRRLTKKYEIEQR